LGAMDLEEARDVGQEALGHIVEMEKEFCDTHEQIVDREAVELLQDVQIEIMKLSIRKELEQ